MTATGRLRRDEAGSTLVEMLVTLVILGIAFVTLLGGMFTAVTTSDRHRKQTVADSALRSFAEAVKQAEYIPNSSPDSCTTGYEASYTPEPALASFKPKVVSCCELVQPSTPTTTVPCRPPQADAITQVLTLNVASDDGRASETVELVKRDDRPTTTTTSASG